MQTLFRYKKRWNYYYLRASQLTCFVSFVRFVYVLNFVRGVNPLCLTSILLVTSCAHQYTHANASNAIHTRYIVVSCVYFMQLIHRNTCSLIRLFFFVSVVSFIPLATIIKVSTHTHIRLYNSVCLSLFLFHQSRLSLHV